MSRLAPLMSSERGDWRTPEVVLDLVRRVAPIGLDPCTSIDNPVGAMAYAIPVVRMVMPPGCLVDGLSDAWTWRGACPEGALVYANPPYGREVGDWTERCRVEGQRGAEVIALLPARTDTRWFHRDVAPPAAQALCLWAGRLTFIGGEAGAPFPSLLAYYGPRRHRFAAVFCDAGAIWT